MTECYKRVFKELKKSPLRSLIWYSVYSTYLIPIFSPVALGVLNSLWTAQVKGCFYWGKRPISKSVFLKANDTSPLLTATMAVESVKQMHRASLQRYAVKLR